MIIKHDILKRLREENGLTLNAVANRIGVTEATVSRYESGQIKRVSPKVMMGYSALFDVPISMLYENPETEWVNALSEAGLRDPRVTGFIEYLEEQAQREAIHTECTEDEIKLIKAWRKADLKTKQLVALALNVTSIVEVSIVHEDKEEDDDL